MKFELDSTYFNHTNPQWLDAVTPNAIVDERTKKVYLTANTLEDLKDKLESISEAYELKGLTNDCSAVNSSAVINFEDMRITLYDYYLD